MLIYYCSFLLSVDMGSVVNPFLKAFHLRCNCWRCGGGGRETQAGDLHLDITSHVKFCIGCINGFCDVL